MTRFAKLFLISALAGTLGLVGCSDDGGTAGTGGGGTGGDGGTAGDPGNGGNGGAPAQVEACGAGEAIGESFVVDTGLVNCNALDTIDVPIELVLAAFSQEVDGETEVEVQASLNLSEDTVGDLGALVQTAFIGEASADVSDVPATAGVNVPATVPCSIDFTADPDDNGTAGPIEVVTPVETAMWTGVDGSIVLEVTDITFAIIDPVPLTLTTKGEDAACVIAETPTVILPPAM